MKQTKKIVRTILIIVCVVCVILAAGFSVVYYLEDKQVAGRLDEPQTMDELKIPLADEDSMDGPPIDEPVSSDEVPDVSADIPDSSQEQSPAIPEPVAIANPYAEYYLANEDMAAWLTLPGTVIDYPVMWTPEDENYYLKRDFNKQKDHDGCLILDTDSSVNPLTTNLIIHGHNMKSGAMFACLFDYEDQSFYEDHKQIILHTEEKQRNYEVIAVFRSQVYKKSDTVFKFYKFFEADTQAEFDDFYNNIKELSLYDTGVTAEYGDNFLTLSTCAYHVENGRFVVVAKEVESGDTYLPLER